MIYRRLYNQPYGRNAGNPFQEMDRMKQRMDALARRWSGGPSAGTERSGVFPPLNVTEDADNYLVRAELPGVEAGDLDIQATCNSLTISGERKIEAENENVKYHRREREAGKFSRIINLPDAVDADRISAQLTGGVLTVAIPKSEASKPRQITIH